MADCDRSFAVGTEHRQDRQDMASWRASLRRLRSSETDKRRGVGLGCSRSGNAIVQSALLWTHARRLLDVMWQPVCRFSGLGVEDRGTVGQRPEVVAHYHFLFAVPALPMRLAQFECPHGLCVISSGTRTEIQRGEL